MGPPDSGCRPKPLSGRGGPREGNVLGLPELHGEQQPGDVMIDTLAPGLRRLPGGTSGNLADASHLDSHWAVRQHRK